MVNVESHVCVRVNSQSAPVISMQCWLYKLLFLRGPPLPVILNVLEIIAFSIPGYYYRYYVTNCHPRQILILIASASDIINERKDASDVTIYFKTQKYI